MRSSAEDGLLRLKPQIIVVVLDGYLRYYDCASL